MAGPLSRGLLAGGSLCWATRATLRRRRSSAALRRVARSAGLRRWLHYGAGPSAALLLRLRGGACSRRGRTRASRPPFAGGCATGPARGRRARSALPAPLSALARARPRRDFDTRHQTCAPGRVARRSGSPTSANFGACRGERRSGLPHRRSFGERCGELRLRPFAKDTALGRVTPRTDG